MFSKLKKFFKNLGPGLVTGAADDDPSGIATYSQTGAQFGYGMLWTAFFGLALAAIGMLLSLTHCHSVKFSREARSGSARPDSLSSKISSSQTDP